MKTIFGEVNESVQLVSREVTENGLTKTIFRYGKLTVTSISNQPTKEAVTKLAEGMNEIAEKYGTSDVA
jgi:TATA-box binding protein (TBP) (component of TFIID and TFIIIB)